MLSYSANSQKYQYRVKVWIFLSTYNNSTWLEFGLLTYEAMNMNEIYNEKRKSTHLVLCCRISYFITLCSLHYLFRCKEIPLDFVELRNNNIFITLRCNKHHGNNALYICTSWINNLIYLSIYLLLNHDGYAFDNLFKIKSTQSATNQTRDRDSPIDRSLIIQPDYNVYQQFHELNGVKKQIFK